ncbi:MAG: substrate-binding domain-containing protein [Verrucomicrobia bacterium]|nr:substrate-binding domain-containing protein [Verrucomicrobiota bacterium]MBT7066256.1 substrate-binding domain-containing protein [Verrucomicrobiota bacterium]MBT7700255.1 substrate-binding domain-containing protein [Verrucomicrobiota bacterium]
MSFDNEITGALEALEGQKADWEQALAELLPGNLVKRVVKGHEYYYWVRRENGKVKTDYRGKLSDEEVAWYTDLKQKRETFTKQIARADKAIRALKSVLCQRQPDDADTPAESGGKPHAHKKEERAGRASPSGGARRAEAKRAPGSRKTKIVARVRPLVVLFGSFPRTICIDLAREWGWDLLDLALTEEAIPDGVKPTGIISDNLSTHSVVKRLINMGCYAVRLGRRPNPTDVHTPAILLDFVSIGRMAAEHFLARGFKTVAHVGWDSEDPDSLYYPMYVSFRQHAQKGGAACHVHKLDVPMSKAVALSLSSYESRTLGVYEWLSDLPKPVGVVTITDGYAASICVMCRHAGIAVPEEVAIMGVGNRASICEVSTPTLSSVDSAWEARTQRGMTLMRELIAGEPAPQAPIVIPPAGVVERQSTDLLAVDDPAVAQALRFMWDHLEQNMSVDDVAEAVGIRRRSLERAFRGQLGRSVNAELRRKRLEHCCQLLKTTDLPIADVAPLSGFSSAGYLNKVFRAAFETTPRQWRVSAGRAS